MFIDKSLDLIISSFEDIVELSELKKILFCNNNMLIKVGFDPTTNDLHLGHLVIITKLIQLQKLGFKIAIVIGDFTAMIGDPSGRNLSRQIISRDQIDLNCKTYISQLFKFLNPSLTNIYFNSSWYDSFLVDNFLKLTSMFKVSRMLERNDFKVRFTNNTPISICEFIYPLLQAYDSVFLNADIELGGIDQKFNLLVGREIQKKFFQKSQFCLMLPLLIGLDGKQKMSKSLNNCIKLNDDFYDMFCKVMSIPDSLIKHYFINLSLLNSDECDVMFNANENPMNIKLELANRIVSLIYDNDHANCAKNKFLDIFSKRNVFECLDCIFIDVDFMEVSLFDVLYKIGFVSSNSDFKRLVFSRSIEVNGLVIDDRFLMLNCGIFYFLKVGKKKISKIFLKKK